MLDLHPTHTEAILERLNGKEKLRAWRGLLAGDAFETHRAYERGAYDTTGSMLHRELREWLDGELKALTREYSLYRTPAPDVPFSLLGHWLDCVDVFVLSKIERPRAGSFSRGDHPWLVEQAGRGVFSAFRIGETAFYLPASARATWQARKWLGDQEPLMRLPYQRKYDSERHGRADESLRSHQERLEVAGDLLYVLAERLSEVDISDGFHWPELADIQAELERLDLALAGCSISAMVGTLSLDLYALEPIGSLRRVFADAEDEEQRRKMDFVVSSGRYRGVLGGYHRRRSGALRAPLSGGSQKWMLTAALNELRRGVEVLNQCGSSAEREAEAERICALPA